MQRNFVFQGLINSGWFWFSMLCCLVAAGLIVSLLRYERQLVSRRVGLLLMTLRLAVVLVMMLTFLEPVVTSTFDREKAGRIVVAVDLSDSMTTVDKFATRAELLRWARALEMIGNSQVDHRLDDWIKAYESGQEPKWVADDEVLSAAKRQELTTLRKTSIEEVTEQVRKLTRAEIVERLLTKVSTPLLPELAKLGNVEVRVFGGQAETIDRSVLGQVMQSPPEGIRSKQSDLALAMEVSAADTTTQIIGVVLVTDGRHNVERDPVPVATRLGNIGVPVVPLMIGSERRPRDLAVVSVEAPQVAFKSDSSIVKARIAVDGYEKEDIVVTLDLPDGTTQTKTVRVPPGSNSTAVDVEFSVKSEEIGRKSYALHTNVRSDETRDDNNRREFAIQVVDDKSRVLLADGEARWEFRFINNALERDERIELTHVVFDQPFVGVLPEPFFPRKVPLPPKPAANQKSVLGNYDLAIIGDVSPANFDDNAWDVVEGFVRDDGGTLVILAGKNHFPKSHRSPALGRMFPMKDLRIVDLDQAGLELPPTDRGFRFRLTPDGEKQTMFQLGTDAIDNRTIWSQLPGHVWGIVGEARPGATVFATARRADANNLSDERTSALAVHQYYGFGQVLWLGIDSTWRWRHRVGDKYHHRFWGQLARWAATNKAAAGNSFVRLSLRENPVPAGQDAFLQTRWDARFLEQNPGLKAFVEVYHEGDKTGSKPVARQPLRAVEGQPLVTEGRVGGLASGSYSLKLVTEGADLGPKEVSTMLYVQEPSTGELSDLSANRELLTKIAGAAQSRLVLPDEVRSIPDLIRPPESRTQQLEETTLWDHWLTLLVFFGLLTTEWVVRKLNGLP